MYVCVVYVLVLAVCSSCCSSSGASSMYLVDGSKGSYYVCMHVSIMYVPT